MDTVEEVLRLLARRMHAFLRLARRFLLAREAPRFALYFLLHRLMAKARFDEGLGESE